MNIYLRAVAALVSDSLNLLAHGALRAGDAIATPAYLTANALGHAADRSADLAEAA